MRFYHFLLISDYSKAGLQKINKANEANQKEQKGLLMMTSWSRWMMICHFTASYTYYYRGIHKTWSIRQQTNIEQDRQFPTPQNILLELSCLAWNMLLNLGNLVARLLKWFLYNITSLKCIICVLLKHL